MNALLTKLRQIWKTKDLRKKIIFTIVILIIFRFAAQTTIPFVDINQLKTLLDQQQGNAALSVFALLTGGAMTQFSVILMGLTPYINASIILQLLGVIVPHIEDLKKADDYFTYLDSIPQYRITDFEKDSLSYVIAENQYKNSPKKT